ncbi:hypothetical protein HMPREF9120_02121 [Neisseria sp. oral taxon 020 str. F0370]|nr:hypothetical protein HMPREF9120_02121 [Neisseria sp. oral taxon 020 str. F0370]
MSGKIVFLRAVLTQAARKEKHRGQRGRLKSALPRALLRLCFQTASRGLPQNGAFGIMPRL